MPDQLPSTKKSEQVKPDPSKTMPSSKPSEMGTHGISSEIRKICDSNIRVPPELPDILKAYAKGAMKTQPPDLLRWSEAYFRALTLGEVLPVKDRVEFPMRESPEGLSPGLLRVIDVQMGHQGGKKALTTDVKLKWTSFGLKPEAFDDILRRAGMVEGNSLDWDKVMAYMAMTIGNGLNDTMKIICDVRTSQSEGMESLVNYKMWWNLYSYLASIVGVASDKVQAVDEFLLQVSSDNQGFIGPKDFTNNKCPPLQ